MGQKINQEIKISLVKTNLAILEKLNLNLLSVDRARAEEMKSSLSEIKEEYEQISKEYEELNGTIS